MPYYFYEQTQGYAVQSKSLPGAISLFYCTRVLLIVDFRRSLPGRASIRHTRYSVGIRPKLARGYCCIEYCFEPGNSLFLVITFAGSYVSTSAFFPRFVFCFCFSSFGRVHRKPRWKTVSSVAKPKELIFEVIILRFHHEHVDPFACYINTRKPILLSWVTYTYMLYVSISTQPHPAFDAFDLQQHQDHGGGGGSDNPTPPPLLQLLSVDCGPSDCPVDERLELSMDFSLEKPLRGASWEVKVRGPFCLIVVVCLVSRCTARRKKLLVQYCWARRTTQALSAITQKPHRTFTYIPGM